MLLLAPLISFVTCNNLLKGCVKIYKKKADIPRDKINVTNLV